jgi:hypothetical protein
VPTLRQHRHSPLETQGYCRAAWLSAHSGSSFSLQQLRSSDIRIPRGRQKVRLRRSRNGQPAIIALRSREGICGSPLFHKASIRGNKRRFGRETNMAQPQMARIACSQCNAWYDSERTLREHMKTAHRQGGSEQGSSPRDGTEQKSANIQPREDPEDVRSPRRLRTG